ncbi:MAG: hypothetical protein NUV77_10680 [Thermoguttaceae bacterium]|jgi:hypothetical protein|nr:hypothetical protein [Thermoguttaceae bacterium]
MTRDSRTRAARSGGLARRDFLARTGRIAAAATLAGASVPAVHAGEDPTIRLALIGCGGRGTGAVANAMNSAFGPVKLVAMADLVESRLKSSYKNLSERFGNRIDVPADRRFVGFTAYKNAIDCLRPGDVAISRPASSGATAKTARS